MYFKDLMIRRTELKLHHINIYCKYCPDFIPKLPNIFKICVVIAMHCKDIMYK